ncbi:hypothetical protein, partial [Paraburkholderia nemoris]|uniref:hypothetical protein n=1 Tax=Paraburkholderia nemoris TaxID=2793076 RepID=UPI001B8D5692
DDSMTHVSMTSILMATSFAGRNGSSFQVTPSTGIPVRNRARARNLIGLFAEKLTDATGNIQSVSF